VRADEACCLALIVPQVTVAEAARGCALPEHDPVLGEATTLAYVGPGHELEEVHKWPVRHKEKRKGGCCAW
jgi:hypothetical protein